MSNLIDQASKSVNNIIAGLVFDVALKAARTDLLAKFPFLALPVISNLFELVLNKFGGLFYSKLSRISTLSIISFEIKSELSQYQQAESTLRAAHLSGDPNALARASDNFKKTLGSLIHFDNAS